LVKLGDFEPITQLKSNISWAGTVSQSNQNKRAGRLTSATTKNSEQNTNIKIRKPLDIRFNEANHELACRRETEMPIS
jgi:hypothetical protein